MGRRIWDGCEKGREGGEGMQTVAEMEYMSLKSLGAGTMRMREESDVSRSRTMAIEAIQI